MDSLKQITIRKKAIKHAAKYILKHNNCIDYSYERICDIIRSMVAEAVNKIIKNPELDYYCVSSMGVTVIIFYEDPSFAVAEILVDPCIGEDIKFDTIYRGNKE